MKKSICKTGKVILTACLLATFGSTYAQGNDAFAWAVKMGDTETDEIYGVTTDAAGNVYATGQFNGTVDFDPGSGDATFTTNGEDDIFITKFDPAGHLLWAKQIGGPIYDYATAIATDDSGNVYVTGQFQDMVDFDPGAGSHDLVTSGGDFDGYVLKLNTNGEFQWAKNFGDYGYNTIGRGIVADTAGNIYTTGSFNGPVDFDPSSSNTFELMSTGEMDIFVLKLDRTGGFKWAKRMGSLGGYAYGHAIALDGAGNPFITGVFTDDTDFDPDGAGNVLTSAGSYDNFVLKLDSNGDFAWVKQWGNAYNDFIYGIKLDTFGNVYTAGYFSGSVDFDPGTAIVPLTSAGQADIFVSKLDPSGNFLWARNMGGTGLDHAYSLDLDVLGNVYTTGRFTGQADFDPGMGSAPLTSGGSTDVYISKLDASGNYIWARQLSGSAALGSNGYSLVLDNSSNIIAAGYFNGTVNFDPGGSFPLTSVPGHDAFILKLYCKDTSLLNLEETSCTGSFTFNGTVLTTSGIYNFVYPNTLGCDSVTMLNLTINTIDKAVISIDGFELTTTLPYASYQWLLNGVPVAGATDASYIVTENGEYTVAVVSSNGCMDTSEVYKVTNVSLGNMPAIAEQIKIYPNPASDVLYISAPVPVQAAIISVDGKVLSKAHAGRAVSLSGLASGVYMLSVKDTDGVILKMEKLIIQK